MKKSISLVLLTAGIALVGCAAANKTAAANGDQCATPDTIAFHNVSYTVQPPTGWCNLHNRWLLSPNDEGFEEARLVFQNLNDSVLMVRFSTMRASEALVDCLDERQGKGVVTFATEDSCFKRDRTTGATHYVQWAALLNTHGTTVTIEVEADNQILAVQALAGLSIHAAEAGGN